MNQFLTDSDATRIVQAVEGRVLRKLKNGAKTYTTWGQVADVGVAVCSVYIHEALTGVTQEDGTEPEASGGFRVPAFVHVEPGSFVKVAIDYETGERWIDSVHDSSAYQRTAIDLSSGYIYLGPGSGPYDAYIYRASAGTIGFSGLQIDSLTFTDLTVDGNVILDAGSFLTWASDTNLYRSAASLLKTDDEFEVGNAGGKDTLRLTSTGADTGITIGGDTNLYRPAADTLKTDDELEIGVGGGKDTLRLTSTAADTGITLGGDVTIYRSGADVLATDDQVRAPTLRLTDATDASLSSTGHAFQVGDTASTNIIVDDNEIIARNNGVKSSLHLNSQGGTVTIGVNTSGSTSADGIQFSSDVNLYRSAAATLKTDGSLVVASNLTATGSTSTEALTVGAALTATEALYITNIISPTALSANTDNWNPTDLAIAGLIRIGSDATPRTLTGITSGGVSDGRVIWLHNRNNSTAITLAHDATSTAANRFFCPGGANYSLTGKRSVMLMYSATDSRWLVLG